MKYFLSKKVLLLNNSFEPIMIVDAKKALIMMFLDKVDSIKKTPILVHSAHLTLNLPSVIKLKSFIYIKRREISLTRKNIFERDNYTCQYCRNNKCNLTIDHVIPKNKGGIDTWENLVTSCSNCNVRKGNYLLRNINMCLISQPLKPSYIFYLQKIARSKRSDWIPYLFMGNN